MALANGWRNPCGGLRWRELDDGRFDVDGKGVILPPAEVQKQVRQSWANFEPEIRAAAEKRGVPVSWLLAVITVETGLWSGNRQKQSTISSGCCVGPMQVMVTPHPNYKVGGYTSPDDMLDPLKNIDTGAAIMRGWMDKDHDLPMILARFNAGELCCSNSPSVATKPGGRVQNAFNLCSAAIAGVSYPELALAANNYAIELGLGEGKSSSMLPWLVGLGFGAIGYAWVSRRSSGRSSGRRS